MNAAKLVSLRKEAEKAVAGMPDDDLKVKAFEVILGHLLNGGNSSGKQPLQKENIIHPIKRQTKVKVGSSIPARILALREDSFFKSQRSLEDILKELARNGWHYARTVLSGPLQRLAQQKQLRRVKAKKDKKNVWLYSEP
jgi:hypothetical protein